MAPASAATLPVAVQVSAVEVESVAAPRKVQAAVGSLWAAYLAVLATLRLQFAQTTAIALGIVEVLQFPLMRVLAPVVATAMGPDLKHWVETVVDTGIKVVAVIGRVCSSTRNSVSAEPLSKALKRPLHLQRGQPSEPPWGRLGGGR